jgi:hypothetical protein
MTVVIIHGIGTISTQIWCFYFTFSSEMVSFIDINQLKQNTMGSYVTCKQCGRQHESIMNDHKGFCSMGCKRAFKAFEEEQRNNRRSEGEASSNQSSGTSTVADGIRGTVEVTKGVFWLINKLKWVIVGVFALLVIWIVIIRIKNKGENDALLKQQQEQINALLSEPNVAQEQKSNDVKESVKAETPVTYYKVQDPDGYSNLRDEPKGNVIKKVYDTEKFEVVGTEGDFKKVKLMDGTVGYIHASRVVEVK